MSTWTAKGVALAPGVSKNGRLYTRENIKAAYTRLAARLADESARPVVMRSYHQPLDGDSAVVVGQVSKVSLTADGAMTYEAVGADTALARDMRELLKPSKTGKPFVGNVSIYGSWGDRPRRVMHEGEAVETADDLIIEAIDFTYTPGIEATTVRVESAPGAYPISETAPIEVAMTDQTAPVAEGSDDTPTYASFTIASGAWSVTVSQNEDYDGDVDIDPVALHAAVQAAVASLTSPAPSDGEASADNDMESAQSEENPVAETTPEVAEATTVTRTLTDADVAAIAAAVNAPAVTTEAVETATEDPKPATIDMAALTESVKAAVIAEMVKEGHAKPTRKGYGVKETAEVSDEGAWDRRGEDFAAAFGLTPASVGLDDPDAA